MPGGRHVGRGTANYLVGLGDDAYLEIIGPDPDARERPRHLPFGIERLTEPALITWAVRTTDIDDVIARSRGRGYDPGDASAMSRRTSAGELLEWRLTPDTIGDGGGLVPFLIDWGQTRHPAASGLPAVRLLTLTAQSPAADVLAARLDALGVDLPVAEGRAPRLHAELLTARGTVVLT